MPDVFGYPGYTNSTITITVNGTYAGDGINGWAGGTQYSFRVRERNKELDGPRQDTTDGIYKEGRRGSISKKVRIMGYFKGQNIPPLDIEDEFVYLNCSVVFNFIGVILVERFREVGVIDGALHFELEGETDGTFTDTALI